MNQYKSFILVIIIVLASYVYAQGTWKVFTKKDGLVSGSVNKIFEDSSGNIWCITTAWGVMKYDGNDWTNYSKKDGLASKTIATIFEDSNGTIWLGGYSVKRPRVNGLMRFNGESFELINRNPTQFIEEDSYGNIWSWSVYGSIVYYDGNEIIKPSKKNKKLPSNKIWSFFEDSEKKIWIGTFKGFAIYDGQDWQQILSKEVSKAHPFAYSIIEDNNGLLWCGTNDGVYSFDGKKWKEYYRSGNPFKYIHFEKLFLDTNSRIWAIIQVKESRAPAPVGRNTGSAIWYFDGNEWKDFNNVMGTPQSKVTKIFEASNGDLWFDTSIKGFHKYDGNSWVEFSKDKGFRSNHFHSIIEDSNGNIWVGLGGVGLKGQGIGKFDGKEWTFYGIETGLPSDRIFSMVEDRNGNIWFASFKGVLKYTP